MRLYMFSFIIIAALMLGGGLLFYAMRRWSVEIFMLGFGVELIAGFASLARAWG